MRKYFLISLCFVFMFVACSKDEPIEDDFAVKGFKQGEEIVLHSVNGAKLTLIRAKKGFYLKNNPKKILMMDFFGTFCSPCKEEAALLNHFYQKNKAKMQLIGLTHFENVKDDVVKRFAYDFSAYYFLSNMKINERIIAQVLKDIDYKSMEQLPFKVVLKDGVYQTLSDYWDKNNKAGVKFYLGKIPISFIQADLDRIESAKD